MTAVVYSSADPPTMECAFSITEKQSDTATVLLQRNFATCCLTISLSRMTLDDEDVDEKLDREQPSVTVDEAPVTTTSLNCTSESALNNVPAPDIVQERNSVVDISTECSEAKENVTVLTGMAVLDEKSLEEPAAKKRRSHTNSE